MVVRSYAYGLAYGVGGEPVSAEEFPFILVEPIKFRDIVTGKVRYL